MPPRLLGGERVVCFARLDSGEQRTGKTRHTVRGADVGPAFEGLVITEADDSEGAHSLFYCDAEWNIVSDTWHRTLEDAKHQAEFEYEGIGHSWRTHPPES